MAFSAHQENSVLLRSLLASEISELAIRLAQQAGEAIQRPLSEAQLRRAFDIHTQERNLVEVMLLEDWEATYADAREPQPHDEPEDQTNLRLE